MHWYGTVFFCNKLLAFYRFPILDLNFKASWVFPKYFDKWHNQQATSLYYLLQSGTLKVTKTYNDFWKLTKCLFTSFYWHFFRLFTGQRGVWIKNVVFVNQHIWQNQCTFFDILFLSDYGSTKFKHSHKKMCVYKKLCDIVPLLRLL
jgi:hypothetical protein